VTAPVFNRPVLSRRVAIGLGVVVVLFVGVVVLPTRSWFDQRGALAAAESERQTLQSSNSELQERIDRLSDDATVERQARELYGYVYPGEESYTVPPAGPATIALPPGWPFDRITEPLRRAAQRRAAPTADLTG